MARRFITLICEICGREFEAGARRKTVHCRECAEELRRKGRGPIQIMKTAPATSLHNNLPLKGPVKGICWEQAESDLAYYLKRFNRFPTYDGVTPPDLDRITDEDRQLANKIAARMSAKTWRQIIGSSIAQVGDWYLLNMTDLEWQDRKEIIRGVLGPLLGHPGIGAARLTKALHRKRPKLIPICDSVVLEAMGVELRSKADAVISCMDRLRAIGREHLSTLKSLRESSRQLHSDMTELRILELLCWVQFGPFSPPHQKD